MKKKCTLGHDDGPLWDCGWMTLSYMEWKFNCSFTSSYRLMLLLLLFLFLCGAAYFLPFFWLFPCTVLKVFSYVFITSLALSQNTKSPEIINLNGSQFLCFVWLCCCLRLLFILDDNELNVHARSISLSLSLSLSSFSI